MFGYTLQDHERSDLIAPCGRWVNQLSNDEVHAVATAILDAFQMWKLRQADSHGRVKIVSGSGMGLLGYSTTETRVPLSDVEPWQCAGPFIKNDIDLAFKLWLDDDPGFAALLASHSLEEIFAIVGLWSARSAAPDSLIRLNGFLVKTLVREVDNYSRIARSLTEEINAGKQRRKATLAKARDAASSERKRKGDELRLSLRKAAFDYLCKFPGAEQDDVVAFLRRSGGFDHRSANTIKRLIGGVRKEMKEKLTSLPAPRTGLYATSQKRNG